MSKKAISNLYFVITAFIWGTAFIAQKSGMDYMGPFTYNCVRSLLGGLSLFPAVLVAGRSRNMPEEEKKEENRNTLIGGLILGAVVFVASSFQQFGVLYTTVGKAGFVSALYIVLVPILSIALKKKVKPVIWACVALATLGLYLLTMNGDSMRMDKGAFYVLCGAFFFAAQILVVSKFAPKADAVKMSAIQYTVAGLIGIIPMAVFEKPALSAVLSGWFTLLYSGVLSCGVANAFQVLGQRHADPSAASLIMSMESVIAAVFGAIVFHEVLSGREYVGCAIIFVAVIVANLPSGEERRNKGGGQTL